MKKYSSELDSPNHLTEFAPLSSDLKQPGSSFSFTRLFKRTRESPSPTPEPCLVAQSEQVTGSSGPLDDDCSTDKENKSDESPVDSYNEKGKSGTGSSDDSCTSSVKEGEVYTRSFSNVLRRISNILDRRLSTPNVYKDRDIKQYWMPDSNCKECYDCGDKFTTFRRRHHCRVCGQIFCSRCCNQEIPGKIIGCPGDLRVCTYCCKVVLQYLQSIDVYADSSSDLRTFQADLRSKLSVLDDQLDSSTYEFGARYSSSRRKNSVGFREQGFSRNSSSADVVNYAGAKDFISSEQTSKEWKSLTQDSSQLRELWLQIQDPIHGIQFHNHRHRLTTYPSCVVGSELVDWLIAEDKACARDQAVAICQALVDSRYLEPVITPERVFRDEYALFRAGVAGLRQVSLARASLSEEHPEPQDGQEPSWVKEIKQDAYTTGGFDTAVAEGELDWDPTDNNYEFEEVVSAEPTIGRMTSSSSLFFVTLDPLENIVSLCRNTRPSQSDSGGASSGCASTTAATTNKLDDTESGTGSEPATRRTSVMADGVRTSVNDDLLKGAMEVNCSQIIDVRDESTSLTGWHSAQNLRQDNGERLAFERLSLSYKHHEGALLSQLLSSQGLSQSWSEIVLPLVHKVAETVKPDVRHSDDDMDIRQYVRIKKIPGGKRSDSTIVNGVVCSKNVAHKRMKTAITNPSILLVSSPIVYQRQENKLLSLDPAVLQEHDYLKNIVAKVASFSPDIILVEKSVSRLAQDFILDLDITLVLNVKQCVLERVARCTQGEIVSSIDSQIARPHLGMCHNFRLSHYQLPDGCNKTLMVFDGCAQHLGCTVLLRGAPTAELKKVKTITQFMILVSFNWMLERSFLMDELAMPPPPPPDDERMFASQLETELPQAASDGDGARSESSDEAEGGGIVLRIKKAVAAGPSLDQQQQQQQHRQMQETERRERRCESRAVDDRSDPLHSYLHSADESIFDSRGSRLQVASMPATNVFRKSLDDTTLSASPGIKYTVPYLESEAGRQCALRRFFPKQLYLSMQFHRELRPGQRSSVTALGRAAFVDADAPPLVQPQDAAAVRHPFEALRLTLPVADANVQTVLADYRARGGCFRSAARVHQQCVAGGRSETGRDESGDGLALLAACMVDALDPFRHQRLSVLFSSYSSASMNAPYFCVNPWIAPMDFYGFSDIPLGGFLERYCFSSTYACPSDNCDTPMIKHVRKFVHESGCIHILIHRKEQLSRQCPENITMWSWCRKCKEGTNVIPMSMDTWSLSFAKYLELRFHNTSYTRRGASGGCTHSLHQDHFQYFGYKQFIAAFKYSPIVLREIVLPRVQLKCLAFEPHSTLPVIEDIKGLAVRGHGIYSAILEKICTLASEATGPKFEEYDMQTQLQAEKNKFKEKIEQIQIKLTSPTIEDIKSFEFTKDTDPKILKAAMAQMYKIDDCVLDLKRHMSETVNTWNTRLLEIVQQRKKEERAAKTTLATIKTISAQVGQQVNVNSEALPPSSTAITAKLAELTCSTEVDSEWFPPPLSPTLVTATAIPDADVTADVSSLAITEEHFVAPSTAVTESVQSGTSAQVGADSVTDEVGKVNSDVSCDMLTSDNVATPIRALSATNSKEAEDEYVDTTKSDKKSSATVKNMISQLLSSPAFVTLPMPFPSTEHYLLPHCEKISLVVYEDEPSSIIAYALSSADYELGMQELKLAMSSQARDSKSSSPTLKRKSQSKEFFGGSLHSADVGSGSVDITRDILLEADVTGAGGATESGKPSSGRPGINPHVEVQFADSMAKFYCRVYFAEQFRRLRALTFPDGEDSYARSLSRCLDWQAKGGKSGCAFCKTLDDRFILKQMTRLEVQSFLNFAPQYIQHINSAFSEQKPVVLTKILGFYRIVYRNVQSNETSKMDLLVMENLFYGHNISQRFDLKGSVRNRMVNTNEKHGSDIVLLDENLIKIMCDKPLYIRPHSKTVLANVIAYDTQFLAQHWVMDYSLLVGFDDEQKTLVVGIIDYIRTFTWDKKLETLVKSTGILGGQGKLPTVVSPEVYRNRFCESMDAYFLQVPDHWSLLGQGVDT